MTAAGRRVGSPAVELPLPAVTLSDTAAAVRAEVRGDDGRLLTDVSYDSRTDIVTVVLRDGVSVAESDEDKPGVILDYDDRGNLVAVEILDASKRITDARRVDFQMTE